jgi:hypothetical protein
MNEQSRVKHYQKIYNFVYSILYLFIVPLRRDEIISIKKSALETFCIKSIFRGK